MNWSLYSNGMRNSIAQPVLRPQSSSLTAHRSQSQNSERSHDQKSQTLQLKSKLRPTSAARIDIFMNKTAETIKNLKCTFKGCNKPAKIKSLCRVHFQQYVKNIARQVVQKFYSGPDYAFGSIDFRGDGKVSLEEILDSFITQNLPNISRDEFRSWLEHEPIVRSGQEHGGVTFDQFKAIFYPHLTMAGPEKNYGSGKKPIADVAIIKTRLRNLENKIRDKLSTQFKSVRDAWLCLDEDHSGDIDAHDFIRMLGNSVEIDCRDLEKIMSEYADPSKKTVCLSYSQFSKWMGNAIQQPRSFYFRHDSKKNPEYQVNMIMHNRRQGKNLKLTNQYLVDKQNLITWVLSKIRQQWKTIRKAYQYIDRLDVGYIDLGQLTLQLRDWGFNLSDQQYKEVFDHIDADKDGIISYNDFVKICGGEIHPGETFYFRQDQPNQNFFHVCGLDRCWLPIQGHDFYCPSHMKMQTATINLFYDQVYKHFGCKLLDLLSEQIHDDKEGHQIHLKDFKKIYLDLCKDDVKGKQLLTSDIKKLLLNMSQEKYITVDYLMNLKEKAYKDEQIVFDQQVVLGTNKADITADKAGYMGVQNRHIFEKQQTGTFGVAQLIKTVAKYEQEFLALKDNLIHKLISPSNCTSKFLKIQSALRECDGDKTGIVTFTELEDIIKQFYSEELGEKKMAREIVKPFCSAQNELLIDYKKFSAWLDKEVKAYMSTKQDWVDLDLAENKSIAKKAAQTLGELKQKRAEQTTQQQDTKVYLNADYAFEQTQVDLKSCLRLSNKRQSASISGESRKSLREIVKQQQKVNRAPSVCSEKSSLTVENLREFKEKTANDKQTEQPQLYYTSQTKASTNNADGPSLITYKTTANDDSSVYQNINQNSKDMQSARRQVLRPKSACASSAQLRQRKLTSIRKSSFVPESEELVLENQSSPLKDTQQPDQIRQKSEKEYVQMLLQQNTELQAENKHMKKKLVNQWTLLGQQLKDQIKKQKKENQSLKHEIESQQEQIRAKKLDSSSIFRSIHNPAGIDSSAKISTQTRSNNVVINQRGETMLLPK